MRIKCILQRYILVEPQFPNGWSRWLSKGMWLYNLLTWSLYAETMHEGSSASDVFLNLSPYDLYSVVVMFIILLSPFFVI
jgi:hypothetical protein